MIVILLNNSKKVILPNDYERSWKHGVSKWYEDIFEPPKVRMSFKEVNRAECFVADEIENEKGENSHRWI